MKLSLEPVMNPSKLTGNVFDIKRFALHDGHGLRTTVFLKGCPLHCCWCQNPEGIASTKQVLYFANSCINCKTCLAYSKNGGITSQEKGIKLCREKTEDWDTIINMCPTNALQYDSKTYTVNQLITELKKDLVFFQSDGGVTFSGGEPLYQAPFLLESLKACKQANMHTAIETTLYAKKEIIEEIFTYVDLIYVDLKILDSKNHQRYVGAKNDGILDNFRYLLTSIHKDKVIVRTPLIPQMTATKENIEQIAKFLFHLYPDVHYELLNYNPLAKAKYEYLDGTYCFSENPKPYNDEQLQKFYDIVLQQGIKHLIIE
ncbi:glycyl radical-activating protein [Erysipelotrichaceae bacterium MTC7]|nr:glycyl radical-activating protein [Erysipelotrichaceae bacterium MTC7]